VTVRADQRASRAATGNLRQSAAIHSILFAAALPFAAPAAAQVGTSVSIFSDDRFRGYSLSGGRPVGILDLSYDAPNGFYAALSGSVVATRHDRLQPLGVELNGGYAKRLSSGLTTDFGIVHSNYSRYSSRTADKSYTEVYAGLAGKVLSSRISVSPDYLKQGAWTVYGELDANVPARKKLRVSGHVGLLTPLDRRGYSGETLRPELDWRLGLARDLGPVTLSVAWTGISRNRDLDQERSYGRQALILGVTWAL
jgi:uncharacterized protein (TIGR02001 family)